MCEGQGEELDRVIEKGVEVGQWGELDWEVWADGICLVLEGAEFEREGLYRSMSSASSSLVYPRWDHVRTPLTILVPTRVMCPLTISFRGVLTTRVLPGSIGARRA